MDPPRALRVNVLTIIKHHATHRCVIINVTSSNTMAKTTYFTNHVDELGSDQKTLFSVVDEILEWNIFCFLAYQ